MSSVLLTSGGFNTEDIKNQFLDFIDRDISQLKVTIITTGSPMKEKIDMHKGQCKISKTWGFSIRCNRQAYLSSL